MSAPLGGASESFSRGGRGFRAWGIQRHHLLNQTGLPAISNSWDPRPATARVVDGLLRRASRDDESARTEPGACGILRRTGGWSSPVGRVST